MLIRPDIQYKLKAKIENRRLNLPWVAGPRPRPSILFRYYSSSRYIYLLYDSISYFLLRSCAPKRVEMMPGRPQLNTKIGKSSISEPLVNDYFELVLQVLPSTLKFNTTPVKLTAPTKMPNNLV